MADIPFGEATMPVVISNDINGYLAQVSSTGAIHTRIEPLGDTVEHFNGTATTSNTTITFAAYSKSILLHNTGSNNLLVSFDGGTNFKTLAAGLALTLEVRLTSMIVKSSTGTTTYENMVVE